jgi:hypothetical protein
LQRELDDLRSREESSRRKSELQAEGARMLETRLKEMQVSVESREREISRKEKELVIKTNETIAQVREEASRGAEREVGSYLRDKATLMLERRRFEEEREADTARSMALQDMRGRFRDLSDQVASKDEEILALNSHLDRVKKSVQSEHSSTAKVSRTCMT